MNYTVVNEVQRSWGYEVRIKILDENVVKGAVEILFPKKPTDGFLNRRCQDRVDQFEQELSNLLGPVIPTTYTADEVTQLLRAKGYLSPIEKFGEGMPEKVKL